MAAYLSVGFTIGAWSLPPAKEKIRSAYNAEVLRTLYNIRKMPYAVFGHDADLGYHLEMQLLDKWYLYL